MEGIDGLDEIIGNLAAKCLIHNLFAFVFGNHHYRHVLIDFADGAESVEAAESGHIFVEEDNVESVGAHLVDGVETVGSGRDVISLAPQKKYLNFQEVNLVVNPKYGVLFHFWTMD